MATAVQTLNEKLQSVGKLSIKKEILGGGKRHEEIENTVKTKMLCVSESFIFLIV
jgi:3'-phosphoadenosine 5'-phosphosulfate sulfotransferase